MTDKGWNKGCMDGQQPQGGWGRRGKRGGGRPTTKDRAQQATAGGEDAGQMATEGRGQGDQRRVEGLGTLSP